MPEYHVKVVLEVSTNAEAPEDVETRVIDAFNRASHASQQWGPYVVLVSLESVLANSLREVCIECGNDPDKVECWMEHYPYMVAYYRRTGSFDYYIGERVREALAVQAPGDTVFRRGDEWVQLSQVGDVELRTQITAQELPPANG